MSVLNYNYACSVDTTLEEYFISWASFTDAIWHDSSWDVFFTPVEYVVEVVFFFCATLLEAILAVRAALYSWILKNSIQSISLNIKCPTKWQSFFPYSM